MDRQHSSLAEEIDHIFKTWNSYGIIKHRTINARMKRYIGEALKNYSMQEICNAIINYAKILHDPRAWYKIKYSLDNFLANKLEWFIDDNKPMEVFYKRFPQSGEPLQQWGGQDRPPASPHSAPDPTNNFNERFAKWKKEKMSREQ